MLHLQHRLRMDFFLYGGAWIEGVTIYLHLKPEGNIYAIKCQNLEMGALGFLQFICSLFAKDPFGSAFSNLSVEILIRSLA